jgi:hypothetical protein
LAGALNEERTCLEAAECIRELIEEIRLVPDNGTLRIEPYGQLAALITLANGHPVLEERGASNAGCNQRCLHLTTRSFRPVRIQACMKDHRADVSEPCNEALADAAVGKN